MQRLTGNRQRLREFTVQLAAIVEGGKEEATTQREAAALVRDLIQHDDWLPEHYAKPNPERYMQYLLHCDSSQRFSIVSFVWAPGQYTPIHDHRVWGVVGVLRGAEIEEGFSAGSDGSLVSSRPAVRLERGDVALVGPAIGDIHRVTNAYSDRVSVSIHVYGGNIGAIERAGYRSNGQARRFVSGYANQDLPNFWV